MTNTRGTAENAGSAAEQLRLLDGRIRRSGAPPSSVIPKRQRHSFARSSAAQARLWYSCRQQSGNSAYTIPRVIEITGPLDLARLRSALSRVISRHEALRTVFEESNGEPIQIILPAAGASLEVIDLDPSEVESWLRKEAARRIDLASGPLLQARVARIGDQSHILMLLWHHIISDQHSARILDDEIGSFYADQQLPEPLIQFGDYTEWEPSRLSGAGEARDFWKSALEGAPPLLDLVFDRVRPAELSHQGRTQKFELDDELASQVRAFGAERRMTLFPVLLAAWVVLLSRYSHCDDFVVGVPVSGRDVPELEKVIGYFVNMLPLRLKIPAAASFADLVRDCWQRFLEASRSSLPFDAILDAARPQRNRSYSPLFQVSLNYLREGGEGLHLEGTTTRKVPFHNGSSLFDVTLIVVDKPGADGYLRFTLEYNAALFDPRMIGQMGRHLLAILREATVPEPVGLGEIGMLSAEERAAALTGRNSSGDLQVDKKETVITWFDREALRRPDVAVIRSDEGEWSWRQLHAFASRVWAALEEARVLPGDIIAVNAERSAETVGVILGIWMCGAVWLPLDPRWPAERNRFVIQDSAAKLVIDRAWLSTHLPAEALDRPQRSSPDAIAYVLYTSGSTGHPKGVAIRHDSLLNCLRSLRERPGFTADDTLLSVTPLSFDISLAELLLPLISGAKLILPSLSIALNPPALKGLLEENDATVLQATPALWRSLIEAGWKGNGRLRAWCGGETMPPDLAESLLDRASEVWNLYGPTETTIWSTIHRVNRGESPVPIGRPMANTRCYVLDKNLEPVPDGVPGELFIGGAGVSPGYCGHAQSQDKFPPDPFVPGRRVYRTGDTVLWSHAGDLIFLHRSDTQVKLRGHRVELGEVETVLAKVPGIRQAAVAVREEALVAWVAPAEPARWDPNQWRAELRTKLPEYMVPGTFVRVDRLPLNSSGKVDRKGLPQPSRSTLAEQRSPDLTEQALKDLWEELLNVRPIGLDDNFFDLGGHSLLAVKLFSRIEKVFGMRLPDSTLFQGPTIASLAAILHSQGRRFHSLVPMQPLGNRPPFFCLHEIGGSVLGLRELARSLGPDQPVYGLQAAGLDGSRRPYIRVEEMAAYYIREIRGLQPKGPYYLGGYCFGGVVAFEMARQLTAAGERIGLLAIVDTVLRLWFKLSIAENRELVSTLAKRTRVHFRVWRSVSARAKVRYVPARVYHYFLSRLYHRRLGPVLFDALYENRFQPAGPILDWLFSIKRAHKIAARRYRPIPSPIAATIFKTGGHQTSLIDPSLGWAGIARNGVEIEDMPGEHVTLIAQPHVKMLAAKLKHRLQVAQARMGDSPTEQLSKEEK